MMRSICDPLTICHISRSCAFYCRFWSMVSASSFDPNNHQGLHGGIRTELTTCVDVYEIYRRRRTTFGTDVKHTAASGGSGRLRIQGTLRSTRCRRVSRECNPATQRGYPPNSPHTCTIYTEKARTKKGCWKANRLGVLKRMRQVSAAVPLYFRDAYSASRDALYFFDSCGRLYLNVGVSKSFSTVKP